MEQNPDKVSVIYYDNNNRPKYFELPKSLYKSLIYLLPSISLISVVVVISGILYFKQIREIAKRSESQEIIDLRRSNLELESKQREVALLNQDLQNRLANKNVTDKSTLDGLNFFKPIVGQKDLSSTPQVSIQEAKFETVDEKLTFRFKIQNDTQNGKKLVGYVFIIHQALNTFNFYPADAFKEGQLAANFNQGELFGATRFRPTKAEFPKFDGQNLFRIVIFSPTGDVLLKKVLEHQIN